jgi:hypothetical protein
MAVGSQLQGKPNEERSAFAHFRLKGQAAAVQFDDDGMSDRQALPGPLAHRIGSEKGVEDPAADRFGNAAAAVFNLDLRLARQPLRSHRDQPLVARVGFSLLSDRVGGVDQQVEQHLVHFSWQAGHRRQFRIQFGLNLRDVFPLVAGDRDGVLDRAVQIDGNPVLVSGVREFLHGLDDTGHVGYALPRFAQGPRSFLGEILDTGISQSRMARRGAPDSWSACQADKPSATATTSCPHFFSTDCRIRREVRSSSAIKILMHCP